MRPKRLDTPEEIERRRAVDRLRVQRKRAAETPEQTAIRLEKQRLRNHRNYRIRCSETPEEIARRAAVRAQQALRIELGLAVAEEEEEAERQILEEYRRPTPLTAAEKAARRKEADRLRHLKARQLETAEDAQRRREAAHMRYQKARQLQTDEEKERRREADRQRKQDARIQLKERRRQAKMERQLKSAEEAERRRESARIRHQKTQQRKAATCKDKERLQEETDCASNQETPEVEIVEIRARRRQATHLKGKMARELETDEDRREADRIRDQKARQRARKQLKPVQKRRLQKGAWINRYHQDEAQPECRLESDHICRQESQELEQTVQDAGRCPSVNLLCSTLLVRQFETVEKTKRHQELDLQTAQLETVDPKCRRESDRVRHQNGRQLGTFEAEERRREAGRICKLKARQLAALVEAEVAEGQREQAQPESVAEQAQDTQSGDVDLEEGRAFHDALKRVIVRTNNNLAEDEADEDAVKELRAAAARLKPESASDGFHEESVVSTKSSADGTDDPKIQKFGSYVGQLASLVPTELRDSCMTAVTDVLYSFMASRVPVVVNPSTPEIQLMNKCRQDAIFKETTITSDS